jgi:hypothetical protein
MRALTRRLRSLTHVEVRSLVSSTSAFACTTIQRRRGSRQEALGGLARDAHALPPIHP